MELDFEKLKREQESADGKRDALNTAASIVSSFEDVPSSYQLLYGKGQNSKSGSEGLRQMAQTVKDPWEKQKKTYELYTAAKNNKKMDMDIAKEERRSDPNSEANKAYRANLKATFPQIAGKISPEQFDQLTIEDGDSFLKPAQFAETIAARKQAAQIAAQSRSDALAVKNAEKQDKKKQAMNEIEDRRMNIKSALKTLDDQVKEYGTYEMFGPQNQNMERLLDQVATDMAKLMDPSSVARPNEVELVKQGLIKSGFKNSNATARQLLRDFEAEVDRRADSAYQIRGLQMPSVQASLGNVNGVGGDMNNSANAGGFPMIVRKDGKKATVNNENELRDAKSKGWQ